MGLIIGGLFTAIVQSSSVAMALTFILASKGYIPYEMAAGMVLGENLGTTITANLAALLDCTMAVNRPPIMRPMATDPKLAPA